MAVRVKSILPPRLYPTSAVIRTPDPESFIRSASDEALNPEKTTVCTTPMRAHASMDAMSSGTMGMYSVTRSPFLTPRPSSALARRHTIRYISPYVMVRVEPSSPSQYMAGLSARVSWCTSRALYDMLVVPPTNQRAKGGFQDRVWLQGSNQCRCRASPSQNWT